MKFFEILKIRNNVVAALIVSLGFIIGCGLVGAGIYQSRSIRTVTVKGLAERNVTADSATWSITIKRRGSGSDLTKMQADMDIDVGKTRKFLKAKGFADEEIQDSHTEVNDRSYEAREGGKTIYEIETFIRVHTNNVELVDKASQKMDELIRQGISASTYYKIYLFGGLGDIKSEMLEQAARAAADSGRQFAKDSGAVLGRIKNANQGVFSIEPRDSNLRWAEEKDSRDKKVRVVSTVTFFLK
ncbi:MAG: SIMPL domain-containing protein [Rickettsiales bacterium]|nr:SIMPL domain-containing protein [Rickettsiales bacterium]